MQRSKKKKQKLMEAQDAKGISRKKWNHTISLELFVLLKIICIVSIPIFYFVYSPLLVVCLIAYVGLFFLSIMAERGMNKSVIKVNHIKIFKFDSALALIIIVVALFGACMTGTSKIKTGNFSNMPQTEILDFVNMKDFAGARHNTWLNSFISGLKNFGSLLTGERSIFGTEKFQFGMKEPPSDFPTDMGDFNPGNLPSGEKPNFEFSMDDLPVEYMFSSILSTVDTVLIFSVCGMGVLSLVGIYVKKRKFEIIMNEVILDDNTPLSDEDIDRILDFGEVVVEKQDTISEKKTQEEQTSNQIVAEIPTKADDNKSSHWEENIEAKDIEENVEILDKNFNLNDVFNNNNDNK